MSILTLEQKRRVRTVGVIAWDNGAETTVRSDWAEIGSYLDMYGEQSLHDNKVKSLIDNAKLIGVSPVKVDWFQETFHQVTYATTGQSKKFVKSRHYSHDT